MRTISLISLTLLLTCWAFNVPNKLKTKNNYILQKYDSLDNVKKFKAFYDTLPDIQIPFKIICPSGSIPTNAKNQREVYAMCQCYFINGDIAIARMFCGNFILIACDVPTSGTSEYLKTFRYDGTPIDKISLFHSECCPSIGDVEYGSVSFDKSMNILQIDSIRIYQKDSYGRALNQKPTLKELKRYKYHLNKVGKFIKID